MENICTNCTRLEAELERKNKEILELEKIIRNFYEEYYKEIKCQRNN